MHTSPRILSLSIAPYRSKGTSVNMKTLLFATVALAALSGSARGESCYCTEQYEPVCASNGKVFSNLCMLRCHNFNNHDNLQVAEFDRCSHPVLPTFQEFVEKKSNCFRLCPHTPLPVCGSDGVTYGSTCALKCVKKMEINKQDVQPLYKGHCRPHLEEKVSKEPTKAADACVCTAEFKPVCGNNLHTYANRCTFECEAKKNHSLKLMYGGRCIILP